MSGGLIDLHRPREGFPQTRLQTKGLAVETGAHVIGAVALGEAAISAHGDGRVRIFRPVADPVEIAAHEGGILAMAPAGENAVLTGGDDGRLLRIGADGNVDMVAGIPGAWIDCVAAHPGTGAVACSAGRKVRVWRQDRAEPDILDHPSTVGGIAFDPKGRRIAVAHYGGATVWDRERRWKATKLVWAGSHIGMTWSPDGKYVVSVMQENALHGWRLRDKADMRMSGYPAKPRAVDWVGEVPHLATSGADQAICWPFDGKTGPMGRGPLCVAYGGKQRATVVRALPGQAAVIAGFQDGAVLMSELSEDAETIVLRGTTGTEVTAIAVTPSLSHILIGDASGGVLWAPLRPAA